MTITLFLVLFFPYINCAHLKHGNLVVPAFQDGILMAILVHQYPLDYESQLTEGLFSIPKQEHHQRTYTDSRVRLVKKRIVNSKLGENNLIGKPKPKSQ